MRIQPKLNIQGYFLGKRLNTTAYNKQRRQILPLKHSICPVYIHIKDTYL